MRKIAAGGEFAMIPGYGRYIAVETAVSIVINTAISAIFVLVVFGRADRIDLWGQGGLAFDFIPQTFMITFMSVLVPTLLTRKRIRAGGLIPRPTPLTSRLPRRLIPRALLLAAGGCALLGGVAVAVAAFAWRVPLQFWTVFAIKLAYGALVALIVTPIALVAGLNDPVTGSQ